MTKRKMQGPRETVTETYTMISGGTLTVGAAPAQIRAAGLLGNMTTLVQADHDNTGDVFVGGLNGQWIRLQAGESITIAVDVGRIYVLGSAAGQVVRWIGLT